VKKLVLLLAVMGGAMAVPLIATLALVGVAASALTCTGPLSPSAPVPAAARVWVGITQAACPALPATWIAAVMAQESGFRPDAYADDKNGGTWGLFQVNASIWQNAYGAPWSADLNANGVWDVKDAEIHAAVGGKYLCGRLEGVRRIRAAHPDWASTRDLSELDALVVAHNAGESRLRSYPVLPAITARFILNVRERMAAWSSADVLATAAPLNSASLPASASPSTDGDVSSVDPACTGVATQPTASG
jgi:hypothetical protein